MCRNKFIDSSLGGIITVALQVRGGGSFGNIDPLIYQLGASSSYSTIFHDITSGSNNGYSAGPGGILLQVGDRQ